MLLFNLLSPSSAEFRKARKDALARRRSREWAKQHPERVKENTVKYKNPFRERERGLQKLYGITIHQYYYMFIEQHASCAGCKKTASANGEDKLFVDHDHVTKKVRGLLCLSCNTALGHTKDSPSTLRSLAMYLERG